ncbi:hypothetical protein Tco_0439784 [Tanacetum coccineum]
MTTTPGTQETLEDRKREDDKPTNGTTGENQTRKEPRPRAHRIRRKKGKATIKNQHKKAHGEAEVMRRRNRKEGTRAQEVQRTQKEQAAGGIAAGPNARQTTERPAETKARGNTTTRVREEELTEWQEEGTRQQETKKKERARPHKAK